MEPHTCYRPTIGMPVGLIVHFLYTLRFNGRVQANGVSSLDYKEHVATGVYFLYFLYGMQQLERRASWMSYTQI